MTQMDPNELVDSNEEADESQIQKLLKSLPKESLIELATEAAEMDSNFRDLVERAADCSSLHRQIYVRSSEAFTTETLVNHFKNFGEILDCKTCCFCDFKLYHSFILFKKWIGAYKACKVPLKRIGGTYVYCGFPRKDHFPERAHRRVSITNVDNEIDVDKLTDVLSKFGELEEGPLAFDEIAGKIKEPKKMFEGHSLYCRLDSDVSDADPELGNLPNPSLPSLSRVSQGATANNAGPVYNLHHQQSPTPLTPEPENPPNPHLSPTNSSSVPHGAADYTAVPLSNVWPTFHFYPTGNPISFITYQPVFVSHTASHGFGGEEPGLGSS